MKTTIKSRQGGFAVVEIVLVVAILAAVAGVGYWVYQQRTSTNDVSSNPTSQNSISSKDRAKQLSDAAKNESNAEDKLDDNQDKTDSSQVKADETATDKVGETVDAIN